MPIAALCFDLDGTLVDSAAGIAQALNTALAEAGLPPFDVATVRGWIGDGPDALIVRALGACALVDPHDLPVMAARLRLSFDAATLAAPSAQGTAYAGIAALLGRLGGRYPMAVVTNKPTLLARAVLEAAGLLEHFAQVRGADLPEQRKPSPLLIRQVARRFGVSAAAVLMVGDGSADLASASAAGSRAAWAGWGYGPDPGAAAGVWRLDTPAGLLDCLPVRAPGCTTSHP